jgi:hypothetical protein
MEILSRDLPDQRKAWRIRFVSETGAAPLSNVLRVNSRFGERRYGSNVLRHRRNPRVGNVAWSLCGLERSYRSDTAVRV